MNRQCGVHKWCGVHRRCCARGPVGVHRRCGVHGRCGAHGAGSDPGPRTSIIANSVSCWLKATSEVCRASDHGRRFTDVSRFTPVQQPGLPEASAFSARRWQPRAFVLSDRGRAGGLGRPVATSGYRRHSPRPDFPRRAVARGAPWRLGALPQRRPRRPRRLRSPRAAEGGRGARGHHGRR